MIDKQKFGRSRLPRIQFEVPADFKEKVEEKCRKEGYSVRFVGTAMFKEYLSLPVMPKKYELSK